MADTSSSPEQIRYPESESKKALFFAFKRVFDITVVFLLIPLTGIVALLLFIFNPWMNKGSIFFIQNRMGRNCSHFRVIKFRTMSSTDSETRSADDALEVDRITRLGGILRKTRIDELPQCLNVLRGEMSLIGPRPDYLEHANHFLKVVPGYQERHGVRPGISGLAQTEVGYVEGVEATRQKVAADLRYIQNMGFRQELRIIWRTIVTITNLKGS